MKKIPTHILEEIYANLKQQRKQLEDSTGIYLGSPDKVEKLKEVKKLMADVEYYINK